MKSANISVHQLREDTFKYADRQEKVAQEFINESTKLMEISKNGDMQAIAKQIRKTSKTCGSCHRNFRKRD